MTPTLSLIVPIYNEEATIDELRSRLLPVLEPIDSWEVILINDGSKDRSAEMLDALAASDNRFIVLHFSRNFGHQPAVTAGLHESTGQCAIIIDADLQDPPELIHEMMAKWRDGYDVVYAQRRARAGESKMKKGTAFMFYRTLRALTEVDIPPDAGDFALLDRKVIDVLNSMPERNRYIRGLRAWVGFRQTSVEFDRAERFAGETKYPFRKMIKLAFDGIFSLSKAPLRLSIYFGILSAALAFLLAIFFIVERLLGNPGLVRGWASIIVVVLFLGGIQLICLGAIGEYIGRTYDEAKQRPFYIVARKTRGKPESMLRGSPADSENLVAKR